MRIGEFGRTEELLKKYGIRLTKGAFVPGTSPSMAAKLASPAEKIGFPVILKIIVKDVLSKTCLGAVSSAIDDATILEKAAQSLFKMVRRKKPNAKIQGVLIQKYVSLPAVSVAVCHDAQFGAVVLVGKSPTPLAAENHSPFDTLITTGCGFAPLAKPEAEHLASTVLADRTLIPCLTDFLVKLSKCGVEMRADILCDPVFLGQNAETADAKLFEQAR